LSLPNGVALNWAAEYLYGGRPGIGRLFTTLTQIVTKPASVHHMLPARFDSANFTTALLRDAAANGRTVFLIGTPKRQTIEAAAAYLSRAIPRLQVVGTFTGYLDAAKEQALVEKLKTAKPDLILVGTGFPRQELLMSRLATKLDHGLMIGEGGSFDYEEFGGHIRRAPAWMRHSGLEWLWRLIREPWRIGRQLAIPGFIWQVYLAGRQTSKSDL
jgi:N-acetylglucosaminyldiphosphoundecaprenol N-acetyl-beta-D-mannosaminyltransferase